MSKGLGPEPGLPPPKVVFEGVKEGSTEEAELFNTYNGEIGRFHFKARQAAQLSGTPQFKMHAAIDGMSGSATYIRNNGQEILRVKLDDEIVVEAPRREPKIELPTSDPPRWLAIDVILSHREINSARLYYIPVPAPFGFLDNKIYEPDIGVVSRLAETDHPERGANSTIIDTSDLEPLNPDLYASFQKASEGYIQSPSVREMRWSGYDTQFPNSEVQGFVVRVPHGGGGLSLDLRLASRNGTLNLVNDVPAAPVPIPDVTWLVQVREFVGTEPSVGVTRLDYDGLTRSTTEQGTEETVNIHVDNFFSGIMAVGKDWVDLSSPTILSDADEDIGKLLDRTDVGTTPAVAVIPVDPATGVPDAYDMKGATFVARITYHRPSNPTVRHGRAKIERVA